MSVENMDITELMSLIDQAQSRIVQIQEESVLTEQQMNQQIQDAITTLRELHGPDNPTKPTLAQVQAGDVSITELLMFTPAEIQPNAGLAIRLILQGLKILTTTVENMARIQTRTLT